MTANTVKNTAAMRSEIRLAHEATSVSSAYGQSLDTWQFSTDDARSFWSDIVSDTYALLPSNAQLSGHRVRARVWMLDDILLSRFEAEANTVFRTPDCIRKTPSELVKLKIFEDGRMDISDDSTSCRLGAGAISFINHDRPTTQLSTNHRHLSVFLPYHLIGFDPSKHPAWFEVERGSAMGRLIEAGVTSIFEDLDRVAPEEAPALAASLSGLIRGALDGKFQNADSSDFQSERVAAIRHFLDDRLGDPSLSGDTVLKKFGLSRTTLYRDFEEYGGIQRYIVQRRLHRAFRILSETPTRHGVVGAVSERLGFGSVHNFSRAFKERFGETPGAVVGCWVSHANDAGATDSKVLSCPKKLAVAQEKLRWAYARYSSSG